MIKFAMILSLTPIQEVTRKPSADVQPPPSEEMAGTLRQERRAQLRLAFIEILRTNGITEMKDVVAFVQEMMLKLGIKEIITPLCRVLEEDVYPAADANVWNPHNCAQHPTCHYQDDQANQFGTEINNTNAPIWA